MQVRRNFVVIIVLTISLLVVGISAPKLMIDQDIHDSSFTLLIQTGTPFQPVHASSNRLSASPTPSNGCTYPLYFWVEHLEAWPEQIVLGELPYRRTELFQLSMSGSTDSHSYLIRELHTAYLNILNGASSTTVEGVIIDANNWLITNPVGSKLSEFNNQRGVDLAATLEGFNRGIFGPGLCSDVPPEPDPATATPTSTPTHTATMPPLLPTLPPFIPTATAFSVPSNPPPPPAPSATLQPSPTLAAPTTTSITAPTLAPTLAPTQEPTQIPPTSTPTGLHTPTLAPGDP